jgi:hypothetical protein
VQGPDLQTQYKKKKEGLHYPENLSFRNVGKNKNFLRQAKTEGTNLHWISPTRNSQRIPTSESNPQYQQTSKCERIKFIYKADIQVKSRKKSYLITIENHQTTEINKSYENK